MRTAQQEAPQTSVGKGYSDDQGVGAFGQWIMFLKPWLCLRALSFGLGMRIQVFRCAIEAPTSPRGYQVSVSGIKGYCVVIARAFTTECGRGKSCSSLQATAEQ